MLSRRSVHERLSMFQRISRHFSSAQLSSAHLRNSHIFSSYKNIMIPHSWEGFYSCLIDVIFHEHYQKNKKFFPIEQKSAVFLQFKTKLVF